MRILQFTIALVKAYHYSIEIAREAELKVECHNCDIKVVTNDLTVIYGSAVKLGQFNKFMSYSGNSYK